MLEKMSDFFEARLDGYDEHMLTNIASADEFYPFTAAMLPTFDGCRVLDLGCGTGLELEYYFALNPTAKVTGIDLSEGMLKIGRDKCCKEGITAELQTGDCEAMPYDEGTFDRIGVAFGVRNFENLPKGLTEMLRMLKPEGKLVILDLSIPRNPIIRWCYKLYFLKILPAIGGWVSGNRGAYEYLPSSVLRFPAPEKFMGMMQEAGFGQVRKKSFTMGICHMYIGIKK